MGDWVILERLGTNEERCWALDSNHVLNRICITATINHPSGTYVTRVPTWYHLHQKFVELRKKQQASISQPRTIHFPNSNY